MDHKRLTKLRRRAFEAGILGNSKMDEAQLVQALAKVGHGSPARSLWESLAGRRTA